MFYACLNRNRTRAYSIFAVLSFFVIFTLSGCGSPDKLEYVSFGANNFSCTESLDKGKTDCIIEVEVKNNGDSPVFVEGKFVGYVAHPDDYYAETYLPHELMHSTDGAIQVTVTKMNSTINPNDSMKYDLGFVIPNHKILTRIMLQVPKSISNFSPRTPAALCFLGTKSNNLGRVDFKSC